MTRDADRRLHLRELPWALVLAALASVLACLPVALAAESRGDRRLGPGVIPPGREERVMAFAMPAMRVEGPAMAVTDVQIDHDAIVLRLGDGPMPSSCPNSVREIRVWLALDVDDSPCGSNPSLHRGDLCVGARECDAWMDVRTPMLDRLATRLAARDHGAIWNAPSSEPRGEVGGLLAPVMRRTTMPIHRVVFALFAVATALALLAGWRLGTLDRPVLASEPRSVRRDDWIPAALLLVLTAAGAWRRIAAARALPLDNDEQWAFPTTRSIVSDDHDAWVHPPLHRAIQRVWMHASQWHDGDSSLTLRGVSVACGILALVAIALSILRATRTTWIGAPFAVLAVASAIVTDSVLARPYALATLFVTLSLTVIVLRTPTRGAWCVALVSAGAAAWTDLLAGLAAVLVLLVALAQLVYTHRRRSLVPVGIAVASLIAWCAVLVPGALEASRHQVRPTPRPADVAIHREGPDLRPIHGMGQGEPSRVACSLAVFATLGRDPERLPPMIVGTALLILALSLSRRRDDARFVRLLPVVLFSFACAIGVHVAIRTRNVAFMPFATLFATALAIDAWARRIVHRG